MPLTTLFGPRLSLRHMANSGYDTAKCPAAWMVLGSLPFQCCSTTWALHSSSVA
jgi:hypothetical protein